MTVQIDPGVLQRAGEIIAGGTTLTNTTDTNTPPPPPSPKWGPLTRRQWLIGGGVTVGAILAIAMISASHGEATHAAREAAELDYPEIQSMVRRYVRRHRLGEYVDGSAVPLGSGIWEFHTRDEDGAVQSWRIQHRDLVAADGGREAREDKVTVTTSRVERRTHDTGDGDGKRAKTKPAGKRPGKRGRRRARK